MGRPRDEFLWEQVEEVSKNGWKCKHCNEEFKGSASRIRNHLSGQGNDISACAAVPEQIRNEALKIITRKRERTLQNSPLEESSSNDSVSFTQKRWREEYATDAFIKLLMCNSSSSTISDVIKYPNVREFLKRAKYGLPSSLVQGDPTLVIEKSVFTIKQEVYQHMLMVRESWKTTCCTAMLFKLNCGNIGKIFTFEKDRYIFGFYCPKGFIFVEVPNPDVDYDAIKDALKLHSPSLDIADATLEINHFNSVNDHLCEFSVDDIVTLEETMSLRCLRQAIQGICIQVCSYSEWAQGLINTAIELQEIIRDELLLRSWYDKSLMEKGHQIFEHVEDIKATGASGLSNFLSIMLLEEELKEKLSYHLRLKENMSSRDDAEEILDNSEFWDDGWKLKQILNMTLKISDFMDTLVPTAGYLAMAIDTVKDTIFEYIVNRETVEKDVLVFLQDLDSKIREYTNSWKAASYLNPVYFLQQHVQRDPDLQIKVRNALAIYISLEEEHKKLDEELSLYRNVFSNLFADPGLKRYHPVKLWEKYGHDLPFLRKLAIKLLSQPVTCMCNQVKKHMNQLQGADDFILRLNVRMMEEFKLLGDDIYSPIQLSQLSDIF